MRENNNHKEYHIKVEVRDRNFTLIDTFTCSGKTALVDVMYRLDEKYNVAPIDFIRRFL